MLTPESVSQQNYFSLAPWLSQSSQQPECVGRGNGTDRFGILLSLFQNTKYPNIPNIFLQFDLFQPGQCVKKNPRFTAHGNCPPPPLINNGYYLSERYSSGEKPYVLPVSGHLTKTFEVGAIARYHCNEGYTLLRLFGQDIYRCSAAGTWSPKQPPFCISRNNNMEPLEGMMCGTPEEVASASYRAVEGVVTPNGALHGTILEYTCNIGYRDTILPCLPSRRTCHAGTWVGALPSCAPFEFCPQVPRIPNGYLATPRDESYRLHSIIKYGCDRGYWMAGVDTMQCKATGCWEPNALPKCIDENLLSTWSEEAGGVSLMAVLISICVATAVISAIMAVCGVMACRRKRAPPPSAPAHWSTHVTVTPDCRNGNSSSSSNNTRESSMPSQSSNGQHRVPSASNGDRVALIAFADQDPVVLPSYEDALREDRMEGRGGPRMMAASGYRQHHAAAHRQRSRHHPGPETHLTGAGKVYSREQQQGPTRSGGGGSGGAAGNRRRPHEPDAVSHSSLGWSGRPQSGSNSASLRLEYPLIFCLSHTTIIICIVQVRFSAKRGDRWQQRGNKHEQRDGDQRGESDAFLQVRIVALACWYLTL